MVVSEEQAGSMVCNQGTLITEMSPITWTSGLLKCKTEWTATKKSGRQTHPGNAVARTQHLA